MDDIEKGPMVNTSVASPPDLTLSPPMSPNTAKRLSQLETYQILVGDVDAPPSPTADDTLYHQITYAEKRVRTYFYLSAFSFFLCVFLQIVFCLTITVGAKTFERTTISVLGAVNTVVAAIIGILKGLGLPDKKNAQRWQLRKMIDRIKATTLKLKAGFEVDASAEAEDLRKGYDAAEDAAQVTLKDIKFGKT